MHDGMRKPPTKIADDWHFFLGMVHTHASVDAEIMGAGHETLHQRCILDVSEEDTSSVWGVNGKTNCLNLQGKSQFFFGSIFI
jgi:hypothetical protein